jgi:hypothetical protein
MLFCLINWFGQIHNKKWGHFTYGKCTDKQKIEKVLEARKIKLEG